MLSGHARFRLAALACSAVLGVLLLESSWYAYRVARPAIEVDWARRVMFLDGRPPLLENHDRFFLYTPRNTLRATTYYLTDTSYELEYDYTFRTNNLGLAQDADMVPGVPSVVFLGDSFTEGQGAAPWINSAAAALQPLGLQAVGAGMLGLGFEQFRRVDRYLADHGVNAAATLVTFIADDGRRLAFPYAESAIACLSRQAPCTGAELFLPTPSADDLPKQMARAREQLPQPTYRRLPHLVSTTFPATYGVYDLARRWLSPPPPDPQEEAARLVSLAAIKSLVDIHRPQPVLFLHIPQKEELNRQPDPLGLELRRAAEAAGGLVIDGFAACGFTLADYHVHDGHMNAAGYAKLSRCAQQAVGRAVRR